MRRPDRYHPYAGEKNTLWTRVARAVNQGLDDQATWATEWMSMFTEGDAPSRLEVLPYWDIETLTPATPIAELEYVPPPMGEKHLEVLACLLKYGIDMPTEKVAEYTRTDDSWVRKVRGKWQHELYHLVADANAVGVSAHELYCMFAEGVYPASTLRAIHTLRESRSDSRAAGLLQPTYTRLVELLWLEYKTNQGYRGRTPDSAETHAPSWFLIRELGLGTPDNILRTIGDIMAECKVYH